MPALPSLESASVSVLSPLSADSFAMYPATIGSKFVTRVHQFVDDSEQRWTVADSLKEFELQYSQVNGYDMSLMMKFFISQKGRHVSTDLTTTFSVQLYGDIHLYCVFDQDDLIPVVGQGETYQFTLKIKQIRRG